MNVDIYVSNKNNNKFLSVPAGKDVTTLKLPSDIDPDYQELSLYKQDIELNSDKPRIALDDTEISKQINENGYAIHFASVKSEIKP